MPEVKPDSLRHGGGRPHTQGTVLARVMAEQGVKVHAVGFMLGVSERAMYNYFRRERRVPLVNFAAVCDFFDMEIEELVGADGRLLPDPRSIVPPNVVTAEATGDDDPFDDGW